MYRAKRGGADRIEIFRPEMRSDRDDRVALESDLRKALAKNQIKVLYQPIIYLPTEELAGFEALVRWEHPKRGMISPVDFIPIAEQSDLIVRLGSHVLLRAAHEAARWQRELPREERPLFVSRQHLEPADLPPEPDPGNPPHPRPQHRAEGLAAARDHREPGDGESRAGDRDPRVAARRRRRAGARRFRHRLFVARLSAALPVRHHQDRSRAGAGERRKRRRRIGHRALDRGAGARARQEASSPRASRRPRTSRFLRSISCEYAQGLLLRRADVGSRRAAALEDGAHGRAQAAPARLVPRQGQGQAARQEAVRRRGEDERRDAAGAAACRTAAAGPPARCRTAPCVRARVRAQPQPPACSAAGAAGSAAAAAACTHGARRRRLRHAAAAATDAAGLRRRRTHGRCRCMPHAFATAAARACAAAAAPQFDACRRTMRSDGDPSRRPFDAGRQAAAVADGPVQPRRRSPMPPLRRAAAARACGATAPHSPFNGFRRPDAADGRARRCRRRRRTAEAARAESAARGHGAGGVAAAAQPSPGAAAVRSAATADVRAVRRAPTPPRHSTRRQRQPRRSAERRRQTAPATAPKRRRRRRISPGCRRRWPRASPSWRRAVAAARRGRASASSKQQAAGRLARRAASRDG